MQNLFISNSNHSRTVQITQTTRYNLQKQQSAASDRQCVVKSQKCLYTGYIVNNAPKGNANFLSQNKEI